MDCLLVRVNNHMSRTSGQALFRTLLWHGGSQWDAVAQWLERTTDNRVVTCSNPAEAAWKRWQFPLPHFASVFRKRH